MKTEDYTNTVHIGRKIERVRRLRGMTQTDLGNLLGITKQAVSKWNSLRNWMMEN